MKLIHIINGLGDGGAEAMLFKILLLSDKNNVKVISLMNHGKYGERLKSLGFEVICLNMKRGSLDLKALYLLYRVLKKEKPDIVQTWMYHSNLLGGIISRITGIKNIFWNIRSENINLKKIKFRNKIVFYCGAITSYFIPNNIITCSKSAIKFHEKKGYRKIFNYIPNGFDKKIFYRMKNDLNLQFKKKWNNKNKFIYGMVARYHPQKNHFLLLEAINELKKNENFDNLFFVFTGENINYDNHELVNKINEYGINDKIKLLGSTEDMNLFYNSIDILILPSGYGEGFPNVIGEAMLTGTPCIVADSGDSEDIVSNYGWVVSKNSLSELKNKIIESFYFYKKNNNNLKELSNNCIRHIEKNYDIKNIAITYNQLWRKKI